MRRRLGLPFLVIVIAAMMVLPAGASSTAQYGCHAQQAAAVEGAIPSTECSFTIACPSAIHQCVVHYQHLDVHGTGLVEGSMSSPDEPAFTPIACSGAFRCGERFAGSIGLLEGETMIVRCAANGIAVLIGVTCSVSVEVREL